MKTTIRREPAHRRSVMPVIVAALVLAALVAVLVIAWQRGGPQPLHEIAMPVTDAPIAPAQAEGNPHP